MVIAADPGKVELQHLAHRLSCNPQDKTPDDYGCQRGKQMPWQLAAVDCDVSLRGRTSIKHLRKSELTAQRLKDNPSLSPTLSPLGSSESKLRYAARPL